MNNPKDNQMPTSPSANEARLSLALERAVENQAMEGYILTPVEIERVHRELTAVKPDAS